MDCDWAARRLDLARDRQRVELAARVRSISWQVAEAAAAAVLAGEPVPDVLVDAERELTV